MNAREFLRQYELKPKQSLAQNFLVDESYLARIAAAATLASTDVVLEIGPGPGTLTSHLAAQAGQVVAVELDDRLIAPLQTEFADHTNVTIVHGDILTLDPGALVQQVLDPADTAQAVDATFADNVPDYEVPDYKVPDYKVVANLPYYITSAVIRHLLEAAMPPSTIVVLIQKEVAERICATPGDLSILAVSVQYYAQPTLVHHVPAKAFYPRPKVDSAVLRLERLPTPAVSAVEPQFFFQVVKAGFSQKRKQLGNTLSGGLHLAKEDARSALEAAGIDPRRRAETLSLPEWGTLCQHLEPYVAVHPKN